MDEKDKMEKPLNQLLQGEQMAVDAFHIFIHKIEDSQMKKIFQDIQNQHRNNMSLLANHIQNLGYMPKEKLGLKGLIADRMINMDTENKDESYILEKAIQGENNGIKMAQEVSRGKIDDPTKDLIEKVLDEDRNSLDRLRSLQ